MRGRCAECGGERWCHAASLLLARDVKRSGHHRDCFQRPHQRLLEFSWYFSPLTMQNPYQTTTGVTKTPVKTWVTSTTVYERWRRDAQMCKAWPSSACGTPSLGNSDECIRREDSCVHIQKHFIAAPPLFQKCSSLSIQVFKGVFMVLMTNEQGYLIIDRRRYTLKNHTCNLLGLWR